ncbi:VIT domain-containing protein [Polyangium jinanense]|uniref:FHA domain-containing protein n=1 Tax=Polyangium jinanense TaxID=2829994 RepID=A0A9X3X0N7_9BACT|nr:VIT domain-containing protein [Polyangium jinanense]MDC3953017.1 FHA domain-containing protein [Polyangium jinanense]MDC3980635.1 FHA domain-containing protein [Polyangium jinanense]
MFTVVVEGARGKETRDAYDKPSILLGRGQQCDVLIGSNGASRKHARIEWQDGTIRIEDLGSTNGTFVNAEQIQKPLDLAPGDVIEICDTCLRIEAAPEVWTHPRKASWGKPQKRRKQPKKPAPNENGVLLSDAKEGDYLSVRAARADVHVDSLLSRARLVVTFHNDLGRTLEGDLVFPLPPMAALRELVVKLGSRTIEGQIRARGRARAEYERAVQAGQSAAIGESEGEDLARLRIAPIEPGEDVEVTLTVDQMLLPIADGHRLIVPLTYMPRYVEDAAKVTETEVAALARPRPTTLAARARVNVTIEDGPDEPASFRCTSHPTRISQAGPRARTIEVHDAPLDRDVQLEFINRPRGEKPAVWIRHDATDGPDQNGPSTAIGIVPPAFADEGPVIPRSVLFLVDRSGSMGGAPMQSAIRAVRGALRSLGPEDRFNVIAFDNNLEALAVSPVPFDDEHLKAADDFIGRITARGGTEASMAIRAALSARLGTDVAVAFPNPTPPDQTYRLRIVVFMTDGDVANAANVLKTAKEKLIDTRLHVLGIGDSVQHSMLAELAQLGGGTYMPVATNEDLERALVRLKNAITAPLWTGIRVLVERDGERKSPKMLEPPSPLDLFAAEPVLFAFRGKIEPGDRLVLLGQRADGEEERVALELTVPADARAEGAATLWALLRNKRLTYRFDPDDDDTLEGLGTTFGLVNRKVALVGVNPEDRKVTIEGKVPVTLPMPANAAEEDAVMFRSNVYVPPPPAMAAPPGGGFVPPPALARPGAPQPPPRVPAPSPAAKASKLPPLDGGNEHDERTRVAQVVAPPPPLRAPAPTPRLSDDDAGLRALLLHQKADGLFDADLGATLAAVAALVGRGHTAREGLFRAELRRTTVTLRGKLAGLSSEDKHLALLALLALALLTMPHGDPAPEGLPAPIAAALAGISLADRPSAAGKIGVALGHLPSGWAEKPLAAEIKRVFL